MKIELVCEECGEVFYRYKSALSKNNFCSYNCFQKYRYNKTLDHDFFEDIDNEEKAYWMGFLFADGNVSNKKRKQRSITLALSLKDKNHIQKFAKIFGASVREYNYNNLGQCVCSVTSKKIWNDLVNKSFLPNKTYTDNDKIFNFIPNTFKRDFIRGFFDGDGGISINKKTNGICLHMIGTRKVLLKIRDFIVKNTFVKNVNLFPKKNVEGLFILEWSGIQQLEAIRKFLYKDANIYLNRKFDRFQIIKNRYNESVQKRECSFRGVYRSGRRFLATIYHNRKPSYLGTFDTEREAALAYDRAIITFGKPLYRLNFSVEK